MLRVLEMSLIVVCWDRSMEDMSLASREDPGVDGMEDGEGDILVPVSKSVMCSSFCSTILRSVRPSDVRLLGS
jgi:hypothetical protein